MKAAAATKERELLKQERTVGNVDSNKQILCCTQYCCKRVRRGKISISLRFMTFTVEIHEGKLCRLLAFLLVFFPEFIFSNAYRQY